MKIEKGTKLGSYRILSQIGEGGMGEVYLAEDTRLRREAALKVLPGEFAGNADRMRRFEQEATAAAALSHPNIAHIYEVGEQDGVHFIAMEFVEGVTLAKLIHGGTDLKKLLRHLQHVAEALSKAHSKGIVHRDLKPDNIMVTHDGHAKVLDFGLAKLVEPSTPGAAGSEMATALLQQHSSPGTVLGTVGYMSPEQAQGKTKEIDHRSDIFSFGCILYEAITRHRAFEGKDTIDSLNRIIREQPEPITSYAEDAPADLQRIVRRCLAKDPDDRFHSIKDVAIELRELRHELRGQTDTESTVPPASDVSSPAPTVEASDVVSDSRSVPSTHPSSAEYLVSQVKEHKKGALVGLGLLILVIAAVGFGVYKFAGRTETGSIRSIAVLPFQNRSGDPNSEYLSDGLAESLIYRLSQLPDLTVSPTSSVIRYKGKDTEVSKIASELGVDAVMTGRLAQIGDDLTISVELVDARNSKLLWGEQYQRKMSELLATQREIAATIAQKLQLKLGGDEKGITKKYTDNNEAYQLYLKGRYHFAKRTKDDLLKAIDYYQQAVSRDPQFAIGYVGLADVYNLAPANGLISGRESLPQAKAAAERALAIDPSLAEARSALAVSLAFYDWNWTESEREFKKAIELNPNVAEIHYYYGLFPLRTTGRFEESIREIKLALELEPLSIPFAANLVYTYGYSGRKELALALAEKTYSLDPNHPHVFGALGYAYVEKEMYSEAIDLYAKTMQGNQNQIACQTFIGVAYARTGQRQKAEETIARCREESKTRYVGHWRTALIYATLGERDKAFADMDQAMREHDTDVLLLNVAPWTDSLRDDPRFRDLLKRMNLAADP